MIYCLTLMESRPVVVSATAVLHNPDEYVLLDYPPVEAGSWLEACHQFKQILLDQAYAAQTSNHT